MPVRARSIRLSDRMWEAIRAEAEREGVSANQWVSEAATARLVYSWARQEHEGLANVENIYDVLRKLR